MKKTLVITALLAAVIALAAAALLLALGALGGPEDPAVAPCRRPPTTLSQARVVLDHRELTVRFTCNGARLAGTLFVPLGRGPHPTVVWLHGSGDQPRLSYGPLVASFVQDGIAFFSYDKRGAGESEGRCCPDVNGRFNLVTSDAVGAVEAARSSSAVDDARVGFLGASAAGWIAPSATEQSGHVRFVAIASPGVLRHSIVARFEQEAGDSRRSTDGDREGDPVVAPVRLRPGSVPRAARRPRALALRRRGPQRPGGDERRGAAADREATRQGLDDRRLPRRRARPLRRSPDRSARCAARRSVDPAPVRHHALTGRLGMAILVPPGQFAVKRVIASENERGPERVRASLVLLRMFVRLSRRSP